MVILNKFTKREIVRMYTKNIKYVIKLFLNFAKLFPTEFRIKKKIHKKNYAMIYWNTNNILNKTDLIRSPSCFGRWAVTHFAADSDLKNIDLIILEKRKTVKNVYIVCPTSAFVRLHPNLHLPPKSVSFWIGFVHDWRLQELNYFWFQLTNIKISSKR